MSHALEAAAIAATLAVLACAVVSQRKGKALDIIAALVMFAAMLAQEAAPTDFPAPLWAALLMMCAIGLAAADRILGRAATSETDPNRAIGHTSLRPSHHGRLHSALCFLTMAALMIMPPGESAHGSRPSSAAESAGMSTGMMAAGPMPELTLSVWAFAVAVLALSTFAAFRAIRRHGADVSTVEASCMTASAALMAAGMV